MVALSGIESVQVAAPTSGSLPLNQDITLPCNGLTPKGVMVLVTRTTSVDTPVAGLMLSTGVWDGTNMRCLSIMAENGVAGGSRDTGRHLSFTEIVNILSAANETVVAQAVPVSLAADKLTIQWSSLPATAMLLTVIYWFGNDCQFAVGAYTGSTTVGGTATVSGLAFRPRGGLTLSGMNGFNTGGASGVIASQGMFALNEDGTVQGQASRSYSASDRPSSGNTGIAGIISTNRIAHRIALSGTGVATLEASHEVTSGTSDGFVVTTRDGTGLIVNGYAVWRFGLRRNWVGFPTIDESSTGTTSTTAPDFTPQSVFAIGSVLTTADSVASTPECGGFCFGHSSTDSEGGVLTQDKDNAATSVSYAGTISFLGRIVSDTGVTVVRETLSSRDRKGFTIDVLATAGFDIVFGYMAVEALRDNNWLPELIQRRSKTVLWGVKQR